LTFFVEFIEIWRKRLDNVGAVEDLFDTGSAAKSKESRFFVLSLFLLSGEGNNFTSRCYHVELGYSGHFKVTKVSSR
jgi:hypothetical protein